MFHYTNEITGESKIKGGVKMNLILAICLIAAALILGAVIGLIFRRGSDDKKLGSAREQARKILEDAIKTAESTKKESIISAKEETGMDAFAEAVEEMFYSGLIDKKEDEGMNQFDINKLFENIVFLEYLSVLNKAQIAFIPVCSHGNIAKPPA